MRVEGCGEKFEPPYVGCYGELGWHVFGFFWPSVLDLDGWCVRMLGRWLDEEDVPKELKASQLWEVARCIDNLIGNDLATDETRIKHGICFTIDPCFIRC